MPIIEVNGQGLEFPDNLSPEELNKAVSSAAKQMGDSSSGGSGTFGFDNIKKAAKFAGGTIGGPIGAFIAGKATDKAKEVVDDPRGAVLSASGNLPALGGMAGMVSGAGAMSAPLAIAGAGLGEAANQTIRRVMGEDPTPPVEFFGKQIPRIPFIGDEASNIVQQSGINAAFEGVGKLASYIPRAGRSVIHAVSPSAIKEEAILERFINKKGVVSANTREQLGNIAVNYTNKLSDKIKTLDEVASKTLSSEMDIPKSKIYDALNSVKAKFIGSSRRAITKEAREAIRVINSIAYGIKKINPLPDIQPVVIHGGFSSAPGTGGLGNLVREVKTTPGRFGQFMDNISEVQMKDIINQFQDLNYSDPVRKVSESVRDMFSFALKSKNQAYKKAMEPVAKAVRLQKIINRKFNLAYDPQVGTFATDATAGKFGPRLLDGGKPESLAAVKALDNTVGGDLAKKTRLTNIKDQFEGNKTTGSRMVMLGRSIGSTLGPSGAIAGAMAGAMMDKAGGKVTAGMVDVLRAATQGAGAPLDPETIKFLFRTLYIKSREETK